MHSYPLGTRAAGDAMQDGGYLRCMRYVGAASGEELGQLAGIAHGRPGAGHAVRPLRVQAKGNRMEEPFGENQSTTGARRLPESLKQQRQYA